MLTLHVTHTLRDASALQTISTAKNTNATKKHGIILQNHVATNYINIMSMTWNNVMLRFGAKSKYF